MRFFAASAPASVFGKCISLMAFARVGILCLLRISSGRYSGIFSASSSRGFIIYLNQREVIPAVSGYTGTSLPVCLSSPPLLDTSSYEGFERNKLSFEKLVFPDKTALSPGRKFCTKKGWLNHTAFITPEASYKIASVIFIFFL